MLSIKPTLIIDLISATWVLVIVFALLVWLPIKSITSEDISQDKIQCLGSWLRTVSCLITGVWGLSYLNLLNWLTLVVLYFGCLILNHFQRHRWQIQDYQKVIQQRVINLVDFLDRGLSLKDVAVKMQNSWGGTRQKISRYVENLVSHKGIIFFILLTAILVFTCLLRWEYPLLGLRFSNPENYQTLLTTRQLLARNYPTLNSLPIFPVLIATVSLLGSVEPMQGIRFLSPIVGMVLVIAVGYSIKTLTNNIYASLTGMLALGVYLFTWKISNLYLPEWLNQIVSSLNSSLVRQWAGNQLELGVVFFLLGLVYFFDSDRSIRQTRTFLINLGCTIVLIGISAPPLSILVAIATIGLLADKILTLTAITLAWIMLAVFAAISQGEIVWMQSFLLTLPVALSLLTGLLFDRITYLFKILSPQWGEIFCLGLVFAISINFLLPFPPKLTYLEYDIAARKSIEIQNIFPAKKWTLVAPVEQLAEIYGAGWYEDLALFVEQYSAAAERVGFDFPTSGEDLFIMVEKIPFVTFPNEPTTLSNSVLSDPTYLYYRSSSGRASLEYEALKMCEAYRQHHPRSDIYYEDREIRIYHFYT